MIITSKEYIMNPFILNTMRQMDNPSLYTEVQMSDMADDAYLAIDSASTDYHEAAARACYTIEAYIEGYGEEELSCYFDVTGEDINLYSNEVKRLDSVNKGIICN